jgi:hypothetical protein
MTRPAGSVALTTLYLDNVLRVRHPPGRRPKGVQKCPRLRKYLNLQAEGGRFELREDDEQVEPKSRATLQTSERNEAKSESRGDPKTTRKNPT